MIQLSGIPFQQSGMWPPGYIESVIILKMHEAPAVYSYQSMDELLFELKLRKKIIESARSMSRGHARFASFAKSRCNPRFWHLTNTGGFWLRYDVKPSDAIRDIYKNSSLYAFECATAKVIIYYDAILNSIDEHLFNQLFQNLYLYSWHFDPDFGIHSFYSDHLIPGDVAYFNNPDFNPKTPWWKGENAVVLGDGKYFGHGLGIRNAEQMIQALNKRRKPGSNQSAYLTNIVTSLSFKQLTNFLMLQQRFSDYKIKHAVIHHNESSISFARYLFYLNKVNNRIT
ncbi:protein-glutamine gamma-glutamyltransferase [Bacillus sp. 1NLA3E]|uniref:protein-glutamine gamma-glutamyltransferase n=1 Tax=Bacillus sp. 1NLA3E TaxID=666686 RepID=UPI000247EE87|nr:protein-glutamine gamma-glutamyltransferase [Bacillus sp. 1NLA3E]AGK53588.1 transglutaminase [Bacillus sp. 1NLA3E]